MPDALTLAAVLPAVAVGVVLGAIVTHPLAYRAGARATERDAAEVARILDGVSVPVVRPVPLVEWPTTHEWAAVNPPPRRAPIAAHASQRVANTRPAGYHPRHALVRAHLKAVGA